MKTNITNRIDQSYFAWLISQIEIPNNKTYAELFKRLHETEFVWIVPNDDNRVADGRVLRSEFTKRELRYPVSVLEVLVALSRRVAWVAGGAESHWAWILIENLQLDRSYDPLTRGKRRRIENLLEALIWRTYERNGQGGFFPLNEPKEDQTKVEIWYQMHAFVNEIQE